MSPRYRWIALSNTTLAMGVAAVNQTIMTISLPAVFGGLHVDPLGPGSAALLLWLMLGFTAATTVFLVSFGRLADMFGRVRIYSLGLILFTVGALLSALTPSTGIVGLDELIVFRIVQGIGAACIFANSTAIVADAFPTEQLGFAIGVNQAAFVGGSLLGVVAGGLLAAVDWRLTFLASVPLGALATAWSILFLRDVGALSAEPLDWWGNLTFGIGLTAVLYGLTEGLTPYGGASLGWSNPLVVGSLIGGGVLLVAFCFIELRVRYPMFELQLFANLSFLLGMVAALLFAVARGGLQFMIVIWLQAVWLPLHGVSYAQTPLQAGLDSLPILLGFAVAAPIGGWLSDLYGVRTLATIGVALVGLSGLLFMTLPADFSLILFGLAQVPAGVGLGLFAAPNTAMLMNLVPAVHRGAASGMRATVWNAGLTASQAVFFTILVNRLSITLPGALQAGMVQAGVSAAAAEQAATLSPGSAIFAALLGSDPLSRLLPAESLAALPHAVVARLTDPHFFAQLLSAPFLDGMRGTFTASILICAVCAVATLLMERGRPRSAQVTAPRRCRASKVTRRTAESHPD